MKRVIKAATAANFAVIRMCLNNESAARWEHNSVSNDMLKLKYFNLSNLEALQVAVALSRIDDYEEIVKYDTALSNETLKELIEISGVSSESEALSYLERQDVGSGEAITFSVRNNGKLIYSSGLKESDFGKMLRWFDNEEDEPREVSDVMERFFDKLESYVLSKGLRIAVSERRKNPYNDDKYEYVVKIYALVDTNAGKLAIEYAEWRVRETSDEFSLMQNEYKYFTQRIAKSISQYKGLEFEIVDPAELGSAPVIQVYYSSDFPGADKVIYDSRPTLAALRRAKADGSTEVAIVK